MPTIRTSLTTLALLGTAAALTACGSMSSPAAPAFNQSSLPATVQVPAGQRIAMETVGAGDITYECRAKKDMPSAFEWVFVGPDAKLMDRSGKVVKRFTVLMVCTWTGDDGVLDESFTYSDGTTQKRIWRLRRQADGRYTGRADDVVGEAVGAESGNAFNWRYTLALPVDGSVYNVQFDDWMYLMNDKVMLNKAKMSKFGFGLGEVTLSFVKR